MSDGAVDFLVRRNDLSQVRWERSEELTRLTATSVRTFVTARWCVGSRAEIAAAYADVLDGRIKPHQGVIVRPNGS